MEGFGGMIMDLHNNQSGRDLYKKFPDSDPVIVVNDALKDGLLMTSPYQEKNNEKNY